MSKLIVDDIELASGDLLGIPDNLPQNKLLTVSNNTIGAASEDIPPANHYLVHDFADGQPTTIKQTLSSDSSQLAGIKIMFNNLVVTASTSSTDVYYGLGDSNIDITQTNYNGVTNYNTRYCGVGIYNNTGNADTTDGGNHPNRRALGMFPTRGWSSSYLNKSNPIDMAESHIHYVLFDKNDSDSYVYRMMGESIKSISSGAITNSWRYSQHWNTSLLSSNAALPALSTPYTTIEFNIPDAITFYEGQISITEYKR